MNNIEHRAEATFDEIRSRFSDISIGDENAKSTLDPTKARFFNFDYVRDGKNFGNITISIIDGESFKVYFDKDIDRDMTDAEKKSWYHFLRQLKFFAMQNRFKRFDVRDIAKSGLNLRDLKHANRDAEVVDSSEVDLRLSEGKMYGTSRSSYQKLKDVKIIARHSKPIVDETKPGARSRNIDAIYIENSLGERHRLPQGTTVNGARAYARHVMNGGSVHDDFGQHIKKIISEMETLKHFARNMRGRTFEDVETQVMVEAAIDHYGKLHRDLFTIRGQRGYEQYRALWQPESLTEDEFDIESLKERFTKRVFDENLMDALPIVHRAYKTRSEQVGEEFESWANTLQENDSPLSKVANQEPYTTQHPNYNEPETKDEKLEQILDNWSFEYRFVDGVYYFDSKEELDRAVNVILSKGMTVPELKVQDPKDNTYGSSTFDRDLSRMSAAVHEDLDSIISLAGLKKKKVTEEQVEMQVYRDRYNPNKFYFAKDGNFVNPNSEEHKNYYNQFIQQKLAKDTEQQIKNLPPAEPVPDLQTPQSDFGAPDGKPAKPIAQEPMKQIQINLNPAVS